MHMKRLLATSLRTACTLGLLRAEQVGVRPLDGRESTVRQGTSWGIPFAKGTVQPGATFVVTDAAGRTVPSESWPLAWWPDGSLKWVGFAAVADRGALNVDVRPAPKARGRRTAVVEPLVRTLAEQTPEGIRINTGVMTCLLPADGSSFLRDLALGGKVIASDAELVAVWERRSGTDAKRTVTQEECLSHIEKISLMQDNPMRAVVKVEGKHRAAVRRLLHLLRRPAYGPADAFLRLRQRRPRGLHPGSGRALPRAVPRRGPQPPHPPRG